MNLNLGRKIKRLFSKEFFIVFLIFILGFCVRAHLMRYELFFGFDSYYHARIITYVIQTMSVPQYDPLAYYQLAEPLLPVASSGFFWSFCALLYKIFTLGAAYNKELWIFFVKLLPAVFGALISASMYFLGKSMYNKKAGLVMGFFAAIVPSFVYRTMSGFLEEDSLGFLWLVIGFTFFVRAIKNPEWNREKIFNSILAGVFFSLMAITWDMFLLIPLVLIAFMIFTVPITWLRGFEKKQIFSFVGLFLISFAIFSATATLNDGGVWATKTYNYVKSYLPISHENIERIEAKGGGVFGQTVGEENTGKQFFGIKYNALILLALVAFFVIPYAIFRNKKDNYSLIIFFWLAITFFMAWSKLKFTYTLGLPIAAAGGVVFNEAFNFLQRRQGFGKKFLGLILGFMLLVGVGAGTFFVTQKFPSIEENNGWKEALYWVNDNMPEETKFFNWWDEGHWISFISERGVTVDNRNYDVDADKAFGLFAITESEEEAYDLVKGFGSTHVIVDEDTLYKQRSLAVYAYWTTDFSDPRLNRHYGQVIPCSKNINQLTKEITYACGNNAFDEPTMNSFPATWTDQPTTIQDGRIPLFIYRAKDNSRIYVFNAASNKTVLARLWFDDPSITHFKETYSNGLVRIYEVV